MERNHDSQDPKLQSRSKLFFRSNYSKALPDESMKRILVWKITVLFYISSVRILQYKILTTLLTKYSTILQIQCHEEQDIMSTTWLLQEKGEQEKKEN